MPTEAAKNRLDLLTIAASAAATLAIGLVAYEYNNLNSSHHSLMEDVLELALATEALQGQIVSTLQHVEQHEKEAEYWKHRIEKSHEAVSECRLEIRALMSDPTRRPDPFTGTMGKRLEDRIRLLEQQ